MDGKSTAVSLRLTPYSLPQATCQSTHSKHCQCLPHSENPFQALVLFIAPPVLLEGPLRGFPAETLVSKPGLYTNRHDLER